MGEILLWGAQVIIALFEVWLCYQFLFITVSLVGFLFTVVIK